MPANDGWMWQGRQQHMWFGHGTKPHDAVDHGSDSVPASLDERIRLLGLTAFAGLPANKRNHTYSRFNNVRAGHLRTAMRTWTAGRHLSRQDFAQTMFGAHADSPGLRGFHDSALSLGEATRRSHLRDATDEFAAGMLGVGLDFFPHFLARAAQRAEHVGPELLIPVQNSRGRGGGPVRAPGGGWVDMTPAQELLIARYNFAVLRLMGVEPNNSFAASLRAPNTVPTEEFVRRVEQEADAATQRAQVTAVPPPESLPSLGSVLSGRPILPWIPGSGNPFPFDPRSVPGEVPETTLPDIHRPWLTPNMPNGAPVPGQVARQLIGRKFRDFDALREAFWKAVATTPELATQFSRKNIISMLRGQPPEAALSEQRGPRVRYELNHIWRLRLGGPVYDLKNLSVMSPAVHIDRHR